MPQIPRYLSPTNGFIPEATGQAIAFVRDPKRFKLNQYVQLIKCEKPIVAYAVLDPDQPVRVPNTDFFRWAPGTHRPSNWNNTGNFIWKQVEVERYSIGYTVDYQAVEVAMGWNPQAFFNASVLTQAMCLMTERFSNLINTTSNWSGNTADANVLNNGAGTWSTASDDPASPHFLAIKRSMLEMVRRIQLATNGSIKVSDLKMVIGPDLAIAMAETAEIHRYLAQQQHSLAVLKGSDPDILMNYGVPNPLYGVDLVVEDSPIVTELPNQTSTAATTNRNFIWPSTNAAMVTRVGGIDGNYGSPSSSTVQRYYYKYDMTVETFDRPRHKLFETFVVDQYTEVLAAARAGYLATNCL